jgi:hypothetical protein
MLVTANGTIENARRGAARRNTRGSLALCYRVYAMCLIHERGEDPLRVYIEFADKFVEDALMDIGYGRLLRAVHSTIIVSDNTTEISPEVLGVPGLLQLFIWCG